MKRWLGFLLLSLLCFGTAHAEYRAYELEIFDRINDRSRVVITSFSPSDFILVRMVVKQTPRRAWHGPLKLPPLVTVSVNSG